MLRETAAIYSGAYALTVLLVIVWEAIAPRRRPTLLLGKRWFANIGVGVINSTLTSVALPITAIAAALLAAERGWGLFNHASAPDWIAVGFSFLVIDLTAFGRHVLFHKFPVMWRIHRTHHADGDADFSTGVRFHPLEAAVVLATDLTVIVAMGAPALAVFFHETLAMVFTFVSHSNVRYPAAIDRVLRLVLVTPDLHRVHHSILEDESNSNFRVVLSVWDYLFGTHIAQPAGGHEGMTFGVWERRGPKSLSLHWLLLDPFLSDPVASRDPVPPEIAK